MVEKEDLLTEDDVTSSLRPRFLDEFPGQEELKKRLRIFIQAAQSRKEVLDHCLLSGPPGLGKTTLARIIAHSLGMHFRATTAPAIRRKGDLAALLTTLQKDTVLFIDEIHRLAKDVEEYLYSAMEDFYVDIVTGEGMGSKSVRFQLPPFTLIGATTRVGLLKAPFRDRFGIVERLYYYEQTALTKIVERSATYFKINITKKGAQAIASRSRGTPRVANRLLKRVRDYMTVKKHSVVDDKVVQEGLSHLGVDEMGLTFMDKKILLLMANDYNGGPVGIDSIASSLSEDASSLEDVYEPFLVQIGFVQRSPKGRVLTSLAFEYLKKTNALTQGRL